VYVTRKEAMGMELDRRKERRGVGKQIHGSIDGQVDGLK